MKEFFVAITKEFYLNIIWQVQLLHIYSQEKKQNGLEMKTFRLAPPGSTVCFSASPLMFAAPGDQRHLLPA